MEPFLSGSEQFWRTKSFDECQGAFVCVYNQNNTIVILTQPKKRNVQSVYTGRLSFHLSFNFTKPFLSGSDQFWRTKLLNKCSGTFVCVYDQNYAIVISASTKKRNVQSVQTGRLIFNFSLNFTEPFLSGSEQFCRTKSLDKCQGAFVCVRMTKIMLS